MNINLNYIVIHILVEIIVLYIATIFFSYSKSFKIIVRPTGKMIK